MEEINSFLCVCVSASLCEYLTASRVCFYVQVCMGILHITIEA